MDGRRAVVADGASAAYTGGYVAEELFQIRLDTPLYRAHRRCSWLDRVGELLARFGFNQVDPGNDGERPVALSILRKVAVKVLAGSAAGRFSYLGRQAGHPGALVESLAVGHVIKI